MQTLTADQMTRVEHLARSRDEKCEQCQSGDYLSCGDEPPRKTLGNVLVNLRCNNLDAHPGGAYQYFEFSEDEARRIGIRI